MTRSRLVLAIGLLLAAQALTAPSSDARTGPRKPKGPKVIVDAEAGRHILKAVPPQQQDTTTEPSISVNPEDPLNAVAVYQAGRVDAGCAQYNGYGTTFDGGKTWKWGAFPKLTVANGGTYPLASDPVVAFGPDDVVYMNHLMCDDEPVLPVLGDPNDLAFSVSKNGGKTWSDPIMVPVERTFFKDDKNWIVVDNESGPGHHLGRIYLVWDGVAGVAAMYSDDRAQTWQGPFLINHTGLGTIPLIMPNGDLAVVYNNAQVDAHPAPPLPSDPSQFDPQSVTTLEKQMISVAPAAGTVPTGGPLVFLPPVTVADYRGTDMRQHRASEDIPTAAVDPNSGRILVAWGDNRFRSDVVNDVVVTHSDDGGLTWSAVRRVNPGKTDDYLEHMTPAIAVGDDGIVRISYRTQQQKANPPWSPYVDTYYQQSDDGGETWSKPLKVNVKVRTDVRFATFSRASAFLGDYSQVAVTGSWAYIVRCEAYRLKKSELAIFPPAVHHTRTWVAVVDADGDGKV